jgi:tight adherence protein C
MPASTIVVILTVFLAIFLFCVGVIQFVQQRNRRREMVRKISGKERQTDMATTQTVGEEFEGEVSNRVLGFFQRVGRGTASQKSLDYSAMRLRFLRAGIRLDNPIAAFWGAKIFLTVLLPLLFIITRLTVFKLMNYQVTVALGVFFALLGLYLPDVWLRVRTDKRKDKILRSLPDALDMLVVCVEAGMGLEGAISRVAGEIRLNSPEFSDELKLVNYEIRAGKKRSDAMRNLALRTNLEEVNSLTTLLIQTEKFGTSLADALRVYSETFRTQRYQRAEEIAAKLPVKLVIPLGLFIFPSIFVVILGPAMIKIYEVLITQFGG